MYVSIAEFDFLHGLKKLWRIYFLMQHSKLSDVSVNAHSGLGH